MNQTRTASAPAIVCVRSQTAQLITSVAIENGESRQSVFSRICARLHLHYGIDLAQQPRAKGESLLTVAERLDLIDKVYELAYADFLYLQAYEA